MGKCLLERSLRLINPSKVKGEGVAIRAIHEGRIATLNARPGSSDIQALTIDDLTVTAKSHDWIVAANDLVFHGDDQPKKLEPCRGMKFEVDRSDEKSRYTDVFEVVPIDGPRAAEPLDAFGILYRVHTKFVERRPR